MVGAMLTVHNLQFGLLTPVSAYFVSCLGSFLGLRCTSRARACSGPARARWLSLAAVSIGGAGIWAMNFIAMLGFAIPGATIRYDVPVTIFSMLIAVGFVGIGLLMVGFRRPGRSSLLSAGFVTGLGVACMHYTAMAAMRMPARVTYGTGLVGTSVLIAIVVATASFWAALRLHGIAATLGAAMLMGAAVSGMYVAGMAAMKISPAPALALTMSGVPAMAFLLPLIAGIAIVAFGVVAIIAMSPTADELQAEAVLLERSRQRGLDV
jgi:NO-binding membrane sensor protein with MHYT domain